MPGPEECRYGFLLNPIKDLTKNWQVDLSKFLGDYLTELADMPITFDGGETVMNFAEAAMLVQGSACVYGRKVEFLWKMVVQMLDLLANKRLAAQSSKGKKGTTDPNETIGFLPIEDMPVCKKHVKEEAEDKLTVKFMPVTPVCLVDKDKTKKAVPLFSLTGDLLGNKDDYRLNSTISSMTGMLCTEMDIEALLRHHVNTSFSPTKSPNVSAALASLADEPELDECPPASPGPPSPEPPPPPSPAARSERAPSEPPASPERRTNHGRLRRRRDIPTVAAASEPWKPVNLYDDTSQKRRPIRRGRITRRPPCLCQTSASSQRKRKLAEEAAEPAYSGGEPATPPTISDYLKKELLSPAGRVTRSHLRHVLPELRPELLSELQRRKLHLDDVKQQKRDTSLDEKDPALLDGAGDTSECGSIGADAGAVADEFPDPADHRVDEPAAAAAAAGDAAPDTYEELVQRRVAEYLSAAQEHVHSTALSRRVALWQEAVLPRLEREERRKEFNIHDYGSRILRHFPDGGGKTTVAFADLVRGEQAPEVARYLLSSLMLANTYNVEITEPGVGDKRVDTMELTLLSRKRHHEALDGYHAPSQSSPRRKSQEGSSRSNSHKAAKKVVRKKAAPSRCRTRLDT